MIRCTQTVPSVLHAKSCGSQKLDAEEEAILEWCAA